MEYYLNKFMDFSELRNLYWFKRYHRFPTPIRRYYRYIAVEKKRLIDELGVPEYLRLLCRALALPRCNHAKRRLLNYQKSKSIHNKL